MSKQSYQTRTEAIQHGRMVEGFKRVALGLSILIYLAFIAYSEYHFYNLVAQFVPSDFQAIGMIAVAVTALTAIALPLALHFWFRSGTQELFAYAFYACHFLFVAFNLILDSSIVGTAEVPPVIANVYAVWVLPASVAIYGAAWTVVWFLDDSSQEIDRLRELEAQQRQAALDRRFKVLEGRSEALEAAFESPAAKTAIARWAAQNAPQLLAQELGMTLEQLGVGAGASFEFWMPDQDGNGVPDHMERLRRNGPRRAPAGRGRNGPRRAPAGRDGSEGGQDGGPQMGFRSRLPGVFDEDDPGWEEVAIVDVSTDDGRGIPVPLLERARREGLTAYRESGKVYLMRPTRPGIGSE